MNETITSIERGILEFIIEQYEQLCFENGALSYKDVKNEIYQIYDRKGISILPFLHPLYHLLCNYKKDLRLDAGQFDELAKSTFSTLSCIDNEEHSELGKLSDNPAPISALKQFMGSLSHEHNYTFNHSSRVALHSENIASIIGLKNRTNLGFTSHFHDIGKLWVPGWILDKPTRLTAEEKAIINLHPEHGVRMIRLSPDYFEDEITNGILYHHLYFDKSKEGYPACELEEIPLYSRIIAVADSYDAMISDRPYRKGKSKEEAVNELKRCSGMQFDPSIVDAFLKSLEVC